MYNVYTFVVIQLIMKKPISLRVNTNLLQEAKTHATKDNRSLTNYIEVAIKEKINKTNKSNGKS
jgi:hypothetical protein